MSTIAAGVLVVGVFVADPYIRRIYGSTTGDACAIVGAPAAARRSAAPVGSRAPAAAGTAEYLHERDRQRNARQSGPPERSPFIRRIYGRCRNTPLVEDLVGDLSLVDDERRYVVSGVVRVARPESLPPASDRYVVVEASAGTGKTYFLEHRVVDLIVGGAELSQILLVTFTDKAVAELRMRIRDLLDRTARAEVSAATASYWELDDAARARLRAAVTAFDHAPIFTIHGFCHRVLIEDAFAAKRLFQQTQVADEVAFDTAFSALLRERFARTLPDSELLAAYLEWGGTVDTVYALRELLLRCARADARVPRRFDPLRAQTAATALREAFGTHEQCERLLHTVNWKGQQRNAPGWLDTVCSALARTAGEPARILGACDYMREDAKKLLKYVGGSPAHASAAAALQSAIRMMPLDEAVAAELLPHVIDRIGVDKAEYGRFDYDDMLELVREALDGPRGGELAHRLRTRTPWVMIDEFQDTDPVQWQIFRSVWMHDEARGLTIVGDPKQAIYGFRGADVATYQAARDELLRVGATQVHLDINRRSTKPLVGGVNEILIGQLAMPLLDKSIQYDHPVKASGDVSCEGTRPPITAFHLQGAGRDDNRIALARAIGAEIEKLRDAPPVWQSRGKQPAFSLGHCMVLTRSNKESVTIAATLRARGLACALVESDRLFETREAAELAAVLDAIATPRDRSARMRALRTRFFDVPWAELMRVVDAPDHHPLIARLFDWAALAGRREYESLFRRLVEDSHFAERTLVLGGGERAIVNTWHLIELLLEEVARSRCNLTELVTRLRRWIDEHEELTDDRDVQRAETDADAIRILTIHKAKGLEAPYVFVFGAASAAPKSKVQALRDAAGRTLVVAAHDEAIKQQLASETEAENQRLAYVALTRAQIRLYLPVYGEKALDATSTYHCIQRCFAPLVTRKHELVEIVPVAVGVEADPPAPADALGDFDVPAPPPVVALAPLDAARAGLAMLSYTRLARDLAAVKIEPAELPLAIDPAEFAIDTRPAEAAAPLIELPPDELPPGADSGLLLHDLFENADLAGVRAAPDPVAWTADRSVATMIADHARERGVADTYWAHAARVVHGTLRAPLALADGRELPPLVDAAQLAREVEFAYPIPGAVPARGLVKGFIDALVVYDNELWVLDYKSDLLGGNDLAASARERVHEHYNVQARLYALAADKLRGDKQLAGLLFAFVRHNIVVPLRVDADTLATWSHWLATLEVKR
ncbi:MAG TPA: UvrD-helicase domain-containing protein [Kofleriaceae bacterium]